MSSTDFAWQRLLHTDAPAEGALLEALFTTYERPDESFLAEHFLPYFLKLDRDSEAEGKERVSFLVELYSQLRDRLHGKLVVVSSAAREEPGEMEERDSGGYEWIGQSVRHLTVGRLGRAVQHAKLWLLHWGADADGVQRLEMVVSSANLTRAAFKGQLQAAWRACLELHPKPSQARLAAWGVLPPFLRELARHSGDTETFVPFIDLLARADKPEGISFVASVPGKHSRQDLHRTPWGAAGLRGIRPSGSGTVGVGILAPFVGAWNADALSRWCASFEGSPDRLALVWIDAMHPWRKNWLLPEETRNALGEQGASLLRLGYDSDSLDDADKFHEEHRPTKDERWSHAKVYRLRRGNSRRLLVTSANFSQAAWGEQNADGGLTIANFELGVCVEQAVWPFDDLEPFERLEDAATVPKLEFCTPGFILWAQAAWDGKKIAVDCRCEAGRDLVGEVVSDGNPTPITAWTMHSDGCLRSAQVLWENAERRPLFVQLTCERETLRVAIFDARSWPDRQDDAPPGMDKDEFASIRYQLLFEQYGGRVADDLGGEARTGAPDGSDDEEDGAAQHVSYSVETLELARAHLTVVDCWANQMKDAPAGERVALLHDGELLIEAFKWQGKRDARSGEKRAIGARLAEEELGILLRYFREA